MQSTQMALTAAVYSVTMVIFGLSFGFALRRVHEARRRVVESHQNSPDQARPQVS